MTVAYGPSVMTVVHACTLLLEAAALAASFGILWLSFWLRDRHRQYPVADFATDQKDGANVRHLVLASVLGSGTRLPIAMTGPPDLPYRARAAHLQS